MKIGLVLDDSLDSSDGVQQYVVLVGEWLRHRGHDVHYLVGSTNRTDLKNIHSLSKNAKVSFNKNKLSVPIKPNKIEMKKLIDDSWDVIHVQLPYSPLMAGRIINALSEKTALVGTFHIAPFNKFVEYSSRLLRLINRKSMKRFDKVLAVSVVAKEFAKMTLDINSTVVPNAINIKKWLRSESKTIDIIFLGRLVERKGCRLFLESITNLSKKHDISSLRVAIVGDGPLRSQLEDYVKQNQLEGIVDFKGFVPEEEKKQLLSSAKISLFPSLGGESFGIVLLEAMASGSLVMVGDNPGYKSVMKDVDEAIVALDSGKIANCLSKLLYNELFYKEVYKKQQEMVKKYDIETIGSAILSIYMQAQSKRKGNI